MRSYGCFRHIDPGDGGSHTAYGGILAWCLRFAAFVGVYRVADSAVPHRAGPVYVLPRQLVGHISDPRRMLLYCAQTISKERLLFACSYVGN